MTQICVRVQLRDETAVSASPCNHSMQYGETAVSASPYNHSMQYGVIDIFSCVEAQYMQST